jgi:hypothetical protein
MLSVGFAGIRESAFDNPDVHRDGRQRRKCATEFRRAEREPAVAPTIRGYGGQILKTEDK